ncbi:hypothetical protein IE81DRAFT_357144 [Ceraceosorus guamensis]|uniref:Phosphatidate cytidylyltransferase n=1 Tax=Ceraceosorus guamensis TaxID=1522189 RepID=A0A316W8R2_9BASI|nr:hypothetical protein IE81DRAFT_357144 [Ceraceosorus guamensis]PWN45954.1 hypothetical protein IE81DRAFT_357144 [Ceraceosorus guamensis]
MPPRQTSRFASPGLFDALRNEESDNEEVASSSDEEQASRDRDGSRASQARSVTASPPVTRGAARKAAKASAASSSPSPSPAPPASSTPPVSSSKKGSRGKKSAGSATPAASANATAAAAEESADLKDVAAAVPATISQAVNSAAGKHDDSNVVVEIESTHAAGTNGDAAHPLKGTTLLSGTTLTPERPSPGPAAASAALASQNDSPIKSSANDVGSLPKATLIPKSSTKTSNEKAVTLPDKNSEVDKEKEAEERKAYWKKVYERTFFTFIMIGGFLNQERSRAMRLAREAIHVPAQNARSLNTPADRLFLAYPTLSALLCVGHVYVILLVLVIQVLVYGEVTALFNMPGRPSMTGGPPKKGPYKPNSQAPSREGSAAPSDTEDEVENTRREDAWSHSLSWYFFAVSNYFLYGESLIYYFKHIVFVDAYFIPFARHHRFLSFMLYTIGFLAFVLGLKRDNLKHQIGLFSWVHMSLLLTVYSSHFIVNNILEGMIWFFLPVSCVVCNDVFAYVCGMLFGKTPLISLSPKKTVEGFVGALIVTEFFAVGWATIFQQFPYMICPATSLGMNAFGNVQCDPNPVFLWSAIDLPKAVSQIIHIDAISYTPFQLHSLVIAAFASLVAPFGGFYASAFKRSINAKDFSSVIPGHGGLTDRFDCQFLMGLFSYVYYTSLIREHRVGLGSVMETVVTRLSAEDQVELYRELARYLKGQGKL